MTCAADHHPDCDWHLDQYDFECTCGAVIAPPPLKAKPQPGIDRQGLRERINRAYENTLRYLAGR